jgi:tetratricopeptide (TPR) repeat protein
MEFLKCLVVGILLCGFSLAHAQAGDTTLNIIEKGKIKIRLEDGKNKLYTNNYRGALKAFREVLQADANNVLARFRIAECYYELKRFGLSKEYIDKVDKASLKKKQGKEYNYLMGKIYHRNEELDKAIEYLTAYKGMAKKKEIIDSEVDRYLAQCAYAKEAMKTKIDVEITNVGGNINSVNPDYSPSITSDGKTMIFTSRRPDTRGGAVDKEYDYRYYEDIYITEWDEEEGEWAIAKGIQGNLNTEFHDSGLSISPDGEYIYIYRNITGVTGSGDIYVSKKSKSGKWGTPKPIAEKPVDINTSYFETSASIAEGGTMFYFMSERPGSTSQGLGDLFSIKKTGKSTWGESVNLGPEINTKFDEKFVYVHPEGNLMFFASDGHESLGGYDIFVCKKGADGKWSKPANLGYPINTVLDEKTFIITGDGNTAYIGAYYKGSKGEADIFKVDCSKLKFIAE